MFVIGVLRGVDRPAIAAVLPNLRGFTVLLDVGANVDPKPWHLLQFAVMGHVYARDILGLDSPRVGLLSVGEEEGKGNELTKEAYEQLKESSLNFVGNVEGRDIYNGRCDVVVTDGFTGNVALKISESLAEMLGAMIKEELTRDLRSQAGGRAGACRRSRGSAGAWTTRRWAGRPLLGIDGAAIICHGASPVKAIKNAVRVAAEWAKAGLNEHIKAALEAEVARGGARGRPRMTRAKITGVGRLRPQAHPDQRRSREDGRHQRRVDRAAQRHPRAPHRRRERGHVRPGRARRPSRRSSAPTSCPRTSSSSWSARPRPT